MAARRDVSVVDIAPDRYLPHHRTPALRVVNRLVRPLQLQEFDGVVRQAVLGFRPDVVLVYKGSEVRSTLVREIQRGSIPVVNIFPDWSPRAHGRDVERAIGCYDLVISAKPYHPRVWTELYGYRNRCVFVPHGYDPSVHYWEHPPSRAQIDVAMCATWRPEYHRLMCSFGRLTKDMSISVAIAGNGWPARRSELPSHWRLHGPITGREYGEFLRSAKLVIAPVTRDCVVRGVREPGDEDTTRTYELAAANCFFVHRRTEYAAEVYDDSEVPMWSDAHELAALVQRWLPDDAGRRRMADAAHRRAVPAYGLPQRAEAVIGHVRSLLAARTP